MLYYVFAFFSSAWITDIKNISVKKKDFEKIIFLLSLFAIKFATAWSKLIWKFFSIFKRSMSDNKYVFHFLNGEFHQIHYSVNVQYKIRWFIFSKERFYWSVTKLYLNQLGLFAIRRCWSITMTQFWIEYFLIIK